MFHGYRDEASKKAAMEAEGILAEKQKREYNDCGAAMPKNPNLHQQATETLRHLDNAHEEADRLGGNLFGEGEANPGVPAATSVHGIMARCSELAAGLVGYLRSLNERAGSRLPPAAEPFNISQEGVGGYVRLDEDEILRRGECVVDFHKRVFELVEATVFMTRGCAFAALGEHTHERCGVGTTVNLPVYLRKPSTPERGDDAGFLGNMLFIRRA